MASTGHKTWFIPDAYLSSNAPDLPEDAPISHEAVCVLNVTEHDAHITMTFYFEDREPIRDVQTVVPAERTIHIRLDKPEMLDGAQIPLDVPYAIRVESSVPIIVQYSRMDVTQPALTLMTTVAWPSE